MLPVRILSTALLKPKGLRSPLHAGAAVALRYKHSNISPSLLQRRTFSSSGSGGGFGHLGHDEDTRYLSPFVTGSYADSIPTDVPKPPVIYALCIDPPFRPLLRGVPIGTTIKDKTLMRVLLERHKKGDPHFIGVFLADRSVVKNDTVEEGKDEPVPDEQLLDVVKEEKSKVETPDSKPATPEYVSAPSSVGSAEKFNEKSQEKTERDAINTSESTISALGVHRIGMYAQVHRLVRSGGGLEVVVSGIHRVKITGVQTGGAPGVQVQVTHHEDGESKEAEEMDDETVAYAHEIRSVIKEIAPLKPEVWKPGVQAYFATSQTNLWILADHASWMTNSDCHQIQEVVETLELKPRLRLALSLLKRELKLKLIQREISQSVDDTIGSNHREYLLKQQLKAIQSKLGASEGKGPRDVISTYKARLEGKIVPPEVRAVIDEECDKLASQQESSSEYHLSLKYLDWLTVMPWGTLSPENFDIAHAESVLNEDHFGMQDVKDRILEFIAAGKLIGRVPNGKIICLLGPPGVGKTSIGRSIARALGRAFHRITVGGMWDSAEIRGHRRTYIGALPGKFVSALKRTQTLNPVIMIDEIDKMGRHRGDPTTALLEVLDPEQNNAFMDSYLDVPMDFSKALFICTANSDDLPGPLADRMEFITLSGYVDDEKLKISQRFLCPRAAAETGLTTSRLTLTDAALLDLIRWYCRESGVRSLQKIIEKVYRKGSLQLVRAGSDAPPVVVDSDNLEKYVGPRKFQADRLYTETPVGVVVGLVVSGHGGGLLYIESSIADHSRRPLSVSSAPAGDRDGHERTPEQERDDEQPDEERPPRDKSVLPGASGLFSTGSLGAVMQESTLIAYTVAKRMLRQVCLQSASLKFQLNADRGDFFSKHRVHLHCPAGGRPKEGPSAGIGITTSLLSLALNRPLRKDLSMTGEITLTGRVLPIGAITPHFVDTYDQVFQLALNYSAPTSAPSGGASVPAAVSDGKSASVDALAALLASASEAASASYMPAPPLPTRAAGSLPGSHLKASSHFLDRSSILEAEILTNDRGTATRRSAPLNTAHFVNEPMYWMSECQQYAEPNLQAL